MGGEGYFLPSIDEINERLGKEPQSEDACPIRFSIGAVMFTRDFWKSMGMFSVPDSNYGALGEDETQLCSQCMLKSRPLMVSNNILVGHLSFGPQNAAMKEYFLSHKEKFMPQNETR